MTYPRHPRYGSAWSASEKAQQCGQARHAVLAEIGSKAESFKGAVSECWDHWSVNILSTQPFRSGRVRKPAWIELEGSSEYFKARYADDLDLGPQSIARPMVWSDVRIQQTD